MVQPSQDGKLYVQTKNGFQQRKIDDTSKPKKTDSESFAAPVRPEILHKQGEGFLAGIRSLSRFCLGISTGIAFVISLGVQMNVHFAPEIQEALQVTVSVLIITTCFGTLCNVDPVGHGGLGRFFKMDPAGLANICVILSVLLSAVADCIYGAHKFENQNATEPVEDSSAYMIVGWVRTALLVIAWGAMSFSDPPGGALYQRIKKQNILSE